ncbi:TPA: hypothetical protein OB624_000864 [Escherichia fergusonii]|nr:hypothetical protein [Escherichia fergusonii]
MITTERQLLALDSDYWKVGDRRQLELATVIHTHIAPWIQTEAHLLAQAG